MQSAIIMRQEHSVLLVFWGLLLPRAENLGSVLSHGQAGGSAREQLLVLASHSLVFCFFFFNSYITSAPWLLAIKLILRATLMCELGNTFYFRLRKGVEEEEIGGQVLWCPVPSGF